ncbi:hypothetical protein GX51_05517 [Blastomyces parvus]|uniref:Uncharacterized protein n=1 Tax=Blastomyces parvus TaxID=2060905 RepID=A0A2B7WX13_9EURO|nr:hypothetical protein GX51_05517 [Blastomyces parvus]
MAAGIKAPEIGERPPGLTPSGWPKVVVQSRWSNAVAQQRTIPPSGLVIYIGHAYEPIFTILIDSWIVETLTEPQFPDIGSLHSILDLPDTILLPN